MREHAASNPQGRHGRHTYDLADFGLTEDDVREVFAEYSEYYGIE